MSSNLFDVLREENGNGNKRRKKNKKQQNKQLEASQQPEKQLQRTSSKSDVTANAKPKDKIDQFGLIFQPIVPSPVKAIENKEDTDSDISPITPFVSSSKQKAPNIQVAHQRGNSAHRLFDAVLTQDTESTNEQTTTTKASLSTELVKSNPSPPTPISPSRMPFQSISTVSTLIQSLEESASFSSRSNRHLLWKEWCIMMREADTNSTGIHKYIDDNYQLFNFKEVLLKSKVLEKVVESVMNDPELISDAELWELFSLTLIGDENTHFQLIQHLKRMGELIRNKKPSFKEFILRVFCDVISEFKVKPDQQRVLISALHTIDKQILEALESLAKHNSKKDSTKNLEQRTILSDTLVRLYEQKRNLLISCVKKKPENSPSQDFDIETMFTKLQNNATISLQLKKLEEDKKKSETHFQMLMSDNTNVTKDILNEEKQLLVRKKQLEDELQRVNEKLTGIAERKTTLSKQLKDYETQLYELRNKFDQREDELRELADVQKEEKHTLALLKKHIVQAKSILSNTLGTRSDVVEMQLQQCTQQYIEKTGVLLEYQNQRMLEILTQKISPLCEKLNHLRIKRQQEAVNHNVKGVDDIDRNIRKYYRKYTKATNTAESILQSAEQINQMAKNNFANYKAQVYKDIHPQLEILTKSENMLLQFNNRVTWVEKEISILSRSASKSDLNYDTDASEFSEVSDSTNSSLAPDNTPSEENSTSSLHNSNSSISSANLVAAAPSPQQSIHSPSRPIAALEDGDNDADEAQDNAKQQQNSAHSSKNRGSAMYQTESPKKQKKSRHKKKK